MKRDQHASLQGVAHPSMSVSELSAQGAGFSQIGSVSSTKKIVSSSVTKKRVIFLAAALAVGLITASVMMAGKKAPVKAVAPPVAEVKTAAVETPAAGKIVNEDVDLTLQARKHWSKYITAQTSNYGYGMLGGINNLSVQLSNRSDYPVDEMVVKVTYIKANGKAWKTKLITANNIAAHTEKKMPVPKVSRGKSVEISIYKVVSKKMQLQYQGK